MKLLFTRQLPPEEAQLEGEGDGDGGEGGGEGGLQPSLLTSTHGQEPEIKIPGDLSPITSSGLFSATLELCHSTALSEIRSRREAVLRYLPQ